MSIGTLGTNFSEILIKIQNFSFMKLHLKISSVKWRPFLQGWGWVKSWWCNQNKTKQSRHLLLFNRVLHLNEFLRFIHCFWSLPSFPTTTHHWKFHSWSSISRDGWRLLPGVGLMLYILCVSFNTVWYHYNMINFLEKIFTIDTS